MRPVETKDASRRPFYSEYAWAFNLIVDRPVRKECATIAAWLVERGVRPGAAIVDAGCGTGRYAIELARRGFVVYGIDRSPDLIDVATESARGQPGSASFTVGDITALEALRGDGILCRGVLNDVVDDDRREAVFDAFAQALRPGGALVLDVREWEATVERKAREPVFRKRVSTSRGELTFESVTTLDHDTHTLRIAERHVLESHGDTRTSEYCFVMRCWTRAELQAAFARRGFRDVTYFGAYDPHVEAGDTDRLVAIARR